MGITATTHFSGSNTALPSSITRSARCRTPACRRLKGCLRFTAQADSLTCFRNRLVKEPEIARDFRQVGTNTMKENSVAHKQPPNKRPANNNLGAECGRLLA